MITAEFHAFMAILLCVGGLAMIVALAVMYFQGGAVRIHPFWLLNRLLQTDRARLDYIDVDRMVYDAAIERLRPVHVYDRQMSGVATYYGIHGAGWILLKLREVDGNETIVTSDCRVGDDGPIDDPIVRKGFALGVERLFGSMQLPVNATPCNKYLMRVALHDGTSLREYVYRNFATAVCTGSRLPPVPGAQNIN